MIELKVLIDDVLGMKVARGFANLSTLSKISRPDIYDVEKNPKGTQRDLSPKHAREAYLYISNEVNAFLPEIFLNIRDLSIIKIKKIDESYSSLFIDDNKIEKSEKIKISRIDGNHRLHFADGHDKKYPPLNKSVSFCMALELSLDEEIKLFKDINDNQKRMNTSHLDNISLRLLSNEKLKEERDLYLAKSLADDTDSPFFGMVYMGGKADAKRFIGLRNLRSGVKNMLASSSRLSAIQEHEVQAKLIKTYFKALKKMLPEAWEKPSKYILLRGAGFWAACYLGAEVIDRALAKSEFSEKSMLKILTSGKSWNWTRDGDFQGYSGQGGAKKIRDLVVREFEDENNVSLRSLVQKISEEL